MNAKLFHLNKHGFILFKLGLTMSDYFSFPYGWVPELPKPQLPVHFNDIWGD